MNTCGATYSPYRIGNQIEQRLVCFLAPDHTGPHKAIVLDSDDNAITETWAA